MQKPVSLDKVVRTAMLVGHQWMPVSAEDKKIVNRIGASMVNEVGASLVNEVGASVVVIIAAIGASVVVISVTMADRIGKSVSIIKRNLVKMVVVVVFVDYKQSLLATKSVERVQKFQ